VVVELQPEHHVHGKQIGKYACSMSGAWLPSPAFVSKNAYTSDKHAFLNMRTETCVHTIQDLRHKLLCIREITYMGRMYYAKQLVFQAETKTFRTAIQIPGFAASLSLGNAGSLRKP
jgi:hypothetical protein